jgi:hypothetical protein
MTQQFYYRASVIPRATVLSNSLCYSAQPFLVATVPDHSSLLQCLFVPCCYHAQPLLVATVLSHFSLLQCSSISCAKVIIHSLLQNDKVGTPSHFAKRLSRGTGTRGGRCGSVGSAQGHPLGRARRGVSTVEAHLAWLVVGLLGPSDGPANWSIDRARGARPEPTDPARADATQPFHGSLSHF